jgi:hypothetical protein
VVAELGRSAKIHTTMRHILACYILLYGFIIVTGCASPRLAGTFDGEIYTSARQDYSVPMPQMGGGSRISGDDSNGVTFRDDFGSWVSFYSLLHSKQTKAMLESVSNEQVLKIYFECITGSATETAYHPEALGGIMSCIFYKQPGGTKVAAAGFVYLKQVYHVEVWLPESIKFLTRNANEATLLKQNELLENRAITLVQTMKPK